MPSFAPIVAIVVSGVAYQLVFRAAGSARLWPMLAVAYGIAFVVAVGLAAHQQAPARRVELVGGTVLGLSVIGIELGTYTIYRSGWPLASATVIASVSITALLAMCGVTLFGEHLSTQRGVGLALALAGATLIGKG